MEVKEVEVLTDVTPPGAGNPKFTAAKSLRILSFTAVAQFQRMSWKGLV